jgi:peptide deformylase
MKKLNILTVPNPLLRQKAEEINFSEWNRQQLEELSQDMILTMKSAVGIGLAAPQIGQSIRLIVVEYNPTPLVLVNPRIIKHSWRKQLMTEGCLSIPGQVGLVKRYRGVKVAALDIKGKLFEIKAKGLLAQVLQHEIDHLDGILFIDKVKNLK